jgi:replicative DNA helicase
VEKLEQVCGLGSDKESPDNADAADEKYLCTFEQAVEAAGGLVEFWNPNKFSGMATPFPKLDRALSGGMQPGEVYVIGANQGAGKTSLALQFAITSLSMGKGVLYFSMEMGHRAMFQRMAAVEARVNLNAYWHAQGAVKDEMRNLLFRESTAQMEWKLKVSTKPQVTPGYIVRETKRITECAPVDVVIVDHMQLMSPDKNARTEYDKFTAISRAMKQTAVEVNVPLVLCSQTSRSNSRDNRDLEASDLRGSGAIEEDAAGVFLLFEDRKDAADAQKEIVHGQSRYEVGPVKTILKIAKNRYGVQGTCIALSHYKGETRFELAAR